MTQTISALQIKTDAGCRRLADTVGEALGFDEDGRNGLYHLLLIHRHGNEEMKGVLQRALRLYASLARQHKPD